MSNRDRTRTRDLNSVAYNIVQQATGEAPKRRPPERDRAQDTREKPKKPQVHPDG
jgi:hypothetical protein